MSSYNSLEKVQNNWSFMFNEKSNENYVFQMDFWRMLRSPEQK